jgi:hypothetical protein
MNTVFFRVQSTHCSNAVMRSVVFDMKCTSIETRISAFKFVNRLISVQRDMDHRNLGDEKALVRFPRNAASSYY